jgi:hypothetical protein
MTAENRWLFDFDDILQVHFVCLKCKAALSVAPHKLKHVPPVCVNCGDQLYLKPEEQDTLRTLQAAFDAMARFKSATLKIRLEFVSPHGKSVQEG